MTKLSQMLGQAQEMQDKIARPQGELTDPGVEDLIVAAHTQAEAKPENLAQAEMAKFTGGRQLPPGLKLPF